VRKLGDLRRRHAIWVIGNRRTGEAICVDPGDEPVEGLLGLREGPIGLRADDEAATGPVPGLLRSGFLKG